MVKDLSLQAILKRSSRSQVLKKLSIGIILATLGTSVYASPSLEGYFQARELVNYAAGSLQKAKVDFIALDYAVAKLPVASQAQLVPFNTVLGEFSTNSSVSSSDATALLSRINSKALSGQYVCRINSNGTVLAYSAENGEQCAADKYEKASLALAKKGDELRFFRSYSQGYFQTLTYKVDATSSNETVRLGYFNKHGGKWIGEAVKVVKGKAQINSMDVDTYDVIAYRDYNISSSKGVSPNTSISFTEQPFFITDEVTALDSTGKSVHITKTKFSSLHQFNGPYRGRHIDSKGWFNWFNQDYVGQYEIGGKKVYAVSDTQNLVVKKDFSGGVDSWTRVDVDKADQGSGSGDWTMYMFNNTNNLIGESPTYCQIKAIAEGKPVVKVVSSTGTVTHPPITNCDQVDPGYTKKVISSFKDGNNKTVSVTSPQLKASAQHIMALGSIVDQGQIAKFTVQDAKHLLSSTRYKAALAEMTPQFLSSKPHDILK